MVVWGIWRCTAISTGWLLRGEPIRGQGYRLLTNSLLSLTALKTDRDTQILFTIRHFCKRFNLRESNTKQNLKSIKDFFGFTRGVLCKAGLLDDGEFGLDCSGLGGGWRWGWLWLHGDWGALSWQAVWRLDPTGVGRQCPCVVRRSWSTPGTQHFFLRLIYICCSPPYSDTDVENTSLK